MTDLAKSSGTLRRVCGALLLVPVVALVWFDQMAAGVIFGCLGCLMGLEVKRITGLPFFAGLIVLALITVQSFPHWMLGLSLTMNVGLTLLVAGLMAAIIVGIFSNRLAGLVCRFAMSLPCQWRFVVIPAIGSYYAGRACGHHCRL